MASGCPRFGQRGRGQRPTNEGRHRCRPSQSSTTGGRFRCPVQTIQRLQGREREPPAFLPFLRGPAKEPPPDPHKGGRFARPDRQPTVARSSRCGQPAVARLPARDLPIAALPCQPGDRLAPTARPACARPFGRTGDQNRTPAFRPGVGVDLVLAIPLPRLRPSGPCFRTLRSKPGLRSFRLSARAIRPHHGRLPAGAGSAGTPCGRSPPCKPQHPPRGQSRASIGRTSGPRGRSGFPGFHGMLRPSATTLSRGSAKLAATMKISASQQIKPQFSGACAP